MTFWFVIIGIILVGSLLYTFRVGRAVDVSKSEIDEEIHPTIRKNWVTLNPVFLAYIIGFGALLLFIAYLAYFR